MSDSTPPTVSNADLEQIKSQLKNESKFKNAIGWFYWIAGLSFLNSLLAAFNANFSFTIGLGITQFIDAVAILITKRLGTNSHLLTIFSLIISLLFSGLFVLFGYLGNKRKKGAIITGAVIYILDGILALVLGLYLDGLFHALALVGIFSGLKMLDGKKQDPSIPVIDPHKVGGDHYYDSMH